MGLLGVEKLETALNPKPLKAPRGPPLQPAPRQQSPGSFSAAKKPRSTKHIRTFEVFCNAKSLEKGLQVPENSCDLHRGIPQNPKP